MTLLGGVAAGVEGVAAVLPSGPTPRPMHPSTEPATRLLHGDLPPQQDAPAPPRPVRRVGPWRPFPEPSAEARYVDIETTGLAPSDPITLVGVSDGHGTLVLVRGQSLSARALGALLADARLLVTFNGTTFDLPRL